jgi:hypothetical protein
MQGLRRRAGGERSDAAPPEPCRDPAAEEKAKAELRVAEQEAERAKQRARESEARVEPAESRLRRRAD